MPATPDAMRFSMPTALEVQHTSNPKYHPEPHLHPPTCGGWSVGFRVVFGLVGGAGKGHIRAASSGGTPLNPKLETINPKRLHQHCHPPIAIEW